RAPSAQPAVARRGAGRGGAARAERAREREAGRAQVRPEGADASDPHPQPRSGAGRGGTATQGRDHLPEHRPRAAVRAGAGTDRVDVVLVGAVAEAVRGSTDASGPVSVVPAPYGRNFERLSRALSAADARVRIAGDEEGETETMQIKLTAEKLGRGQLWTIRC